MKKIIIAIILLISIIIPVNVYADTGPKPSIEVNIKNLKTKNYLVDLFVYDKDGKNYKSDEDYNGGGLTEEQITKLHELNFDGWISSSTRWSRYIMFADCAGNEEFKNNFGYFGTPTRYKIVIVNNDTGEIKISEEIVRKEFNSVVTIDYNDMKVAEVNNNILKTFIIAAIVLVLTIVIELGIALLFKTSNYITIAITNLISNVVLQSLLLIFSSNYLLVFIIGEVLVIGAELLVYLLRLKKLSKAKTIIYTLVANLATILVTFLLYMI
ncbi:MAG: hypothetical protein IK137_03015 [Bacilli bacterium]|nr:hypothetical protein [Bacilli bacterium]